MKMSLLACKWLSMLPVTVGTVMLWSRVPKGRQAATDMTSFSAHLAFLMIICDDFMAACLFDITFGDRGVPQHGRS